MRTGCEFYADGLVEHAAGVLDDQRAARIAEHLDGCAECRDTLRAIRTLRAEPLEVPADLETRIRSAVRQAAGLPPVAVEPEVAAEVETAPAASRRRPAPAVAQWRSWALPLAAAAALVGIWFGVGAPGTDPSSGESTLAALNEYEPFGAWPADGLIVAGDPLLSELSVEELEALLREMGS